jgi:hypothetical protein
VHIGEPSLFRFYVLDKINASLIPLLFKPFVKFDIAYSPPPLGDICVLSVITKAQVQLGKLMISIHYLILSKSMENH